MHFWFFLATLFLVIETVCAESAKVSVVRNQAHPPYGWWDASRQQQFGFIPSLGDKILTELGIDISYVDIDPPDTDDYAYVLDYLQSGKLNFVVTSEDIARNLSFVRTLEPSVTAIQFRVFVRADRAFTFQQWSDLKGKRGLVQGFPDELVVTTAAFDRYAASVDLNIKSVESLQAMVTALEQDDADYLISVYRSALIHLRMNDKQDTIIALDTPVASVGLHYVIPLDSALVKRADDIEALLKRYKEQGRLDFMMNEAMQRYLIDAK